MLPSRGLRDGQQAPEAVFKGLVRVSPTQHIRERLLEEITAGTYGPGDLLPSERSLSEMFEVSRVSVREAIAGLEAMGVVSVQHGRGCFVAQSASDKFSGPFGDWLQHHHDEMVELLKVRGALDGLAAFETAQLGQPKILRKLESINKTYGSLVEEDRPSLDKLVSLDVRFHGAIAEGSNSRLLSDLLSELNTHIADSRRLTFLSKGQPRRSWHEHSAILEAIRLGQAEDAKARAIAHVESVLQIMESDL